MQKKTLIAIVAGMALLIAGMSWADVPAPPVNQSIGFDDKVFNDFTEVECRVCHDDPGITGPTSNVDRHHLLYGGTMPVGECSENTGNCSVTTAQDCVADIDCPVGETCIDNPVGPCFTDAECATPLNLCNIRGQDCPVGNCSITTATSCEVDADCPVGETCDVGSCPQSYTGQVCGQPFCLGATAAPNNPSGGLYGCLSCHDQDTTGGVTNFIVYRDCTVCHVQVTNTPSVHHLDESLTGAKTGVCTSCHGTVVDDMPGCMDTQCVATGAPCFYDADCDAVTPGDVCEKVGQLACDDGHVIPTYAPSLVTPVPSDHTHACDATGDPCEDNTDCAEGACDVSGDPCHDEGDCPVGEVCVGGDFCDEDVDLSMAGSCTYCHEPGTDTASGVEVVDNHDTHHGTGVYKNRFGGTFDSAICERCHVAGNPHAPGGFEADRIRNCENCHGLESLHNIQDDSPNAANIGTIVVGGEDAGYGHVGEDTPGGDSDCWGCHGFSIASAPSTGPIAPTISSADITSLPAGTATAITLGGSAFTNTSGATEYTSTVSLTATDGAVTALAPDAISASSLTVTIPDTTAVGIYALRAVKADAQSNPVIISVTPAVEIASATCKATCAGDTITIIGSGFGEKPAGTDDYINVEQNGVSIFIDSWTDTQIKALNGACGDSVTVNALFGSATK